jgi:putative oxidoreductase
MIMASPSRPSSEPSYVRKASDAAALTALRIGVGVIMLAHGWQKATGFPAWQESVAQLGVPLPEISSRVAVAAELGGGALLVLGMLTPLAGIAVVLDLVVAIVLVHASHGLFAQAGGFEYPLVLALAALFFAIHGGGPFAVDAVVARRARDARRRPEPVHGSGVSTAARI